MSEEPPDWLPALQLFSGNPEDWPDYESTLYGVFDVDFISGNAVLWGKRIRVIQGMQHNRNKGFWHMLSKEEVDDPRQCARPAELLRCARLRWARAVIDAANAEDQTKVAWWENERSNSRGSSRRTLIALKDFSYLVALDKRPDHYIIWTQYPLVEEYERKKKKAECVKYWQ